MVRSTFAGFTTAQLALQNSQRALDVTGQNIANINTVGYTRQRLDMVSLNLRNGNYTNSQHDVRIGYGSEIQSLSQIRDPFLDVQYRNQASKVGETDSKLATLENLKAIFDETNQTAIKAAFADLTSQLRKYAEDENVGKQEFDTMVRSSCENLVNLFHNYSNSLTSKKAEDAEEFKNSTVPDINQMLDNLAELNKTIKNSQIAGNAALELIDERNLLLDELSGYLPIQVKYNDVQFSPGHTIQELSVDLVTADGNKKLVRDSKVASFGATVDAKNNVSLSFNALDGSTINNIQEKLSGGSLKGTADMLNKSGGLVSGSSNDPKGYDYYAASLDCLVNVFATTLNKLNTDAGGSVLFETTGTGAISASNIKVSDGWMDGTTTVKTSTGTSATGGTTANDNLLKMAAAMEEKRNFVSSTGVNLGFNGSFYSCYTNMENILGLDQSSTTALLKTQLSVAQEIANNRDEVSGVQLDEEGISLMHYMQSYNAAARLMTTLDEALNTLINSTGVVGR